MRQRAFTLLEILLVLGVLTVISGLSIPTYLEYRIRNDLFTAAEQMRQALGRARLLAQSGQAATTWGLNVPHATIFAGPRYADRDSTHDTIIILPQEIAISGLEEVTFSQMEGIPSATGSIVLTSLRNEQAQISVLIERKQISINIDDHLTICHCISDPPVTLRIPEASWPAHRAHGDYIGACSLTDPWAGCNHRK